MLNNILDLIKNIEASLGSIVPESVRIIFYGIISGSLVMGIYYLVSNQSEIAILKDEIKELQKKLFKEDMEFDEFSATSILNLKKSLLLLSKALIPAILSSLPILIVIVVLAHCFNSWEIPYFIAVLVSSIATKIFFRIK